MAKASKRPRTGDPRKARQPLSIDLLPMDALDAIRRLRNTHGLSWEEIERLSSMPYGEKWEEKIGSAGFVNWDALSTRVLEKFPKLRLPHTNLHRWYDLRVDQAMRDLARDSAVAHEVAQAFAAGGLDKDDEAVINAVRDICLRQLVDAKSEDAKTVVRDALVDLAHVMQKARANDIRKGVLEQRKREIDLLEKKLELVKQKAGKLKETIEATDGGKPLQLTREQLLEQVKEIYGAV